MACLCIPLPTSLQKLKARRASARELKKKQNELRAVYQMMRAADDRFNNAYASQEDEGQNIYAYKTRDMNASLPQTREIRSSSITGEFIH